MGLILLILREIYSWKKLKNGEKHHKRNEGMKRQQRTIGSILSIDLEDGYYNYAQILEFGIAFFDIHVKESKLVSLDSLLEKPILFIVEVYNDVITRGRWVKIGKLPIRKDLEILPMEFIQDALNPQNFELYNPRTGEIIPSTREECEGLERSAVWDSNHVEDRLRDYYAGRPCIWVEQLKIK